MNARTSIVTGAMVASLAPGLASCTEPIPNVSVTAQAAYTLSTTEVNIGSVIVGSSGYGSVVLSPSNLVGNTIDAVVWDCDEMTLSYPTLPFEVWRECVNMPPAQGAVAVALPPICKGEYIEHTMFIDIEFQPAAVGGYSCGVTVQSEQGDKFFSIQGTGVPTPHDILVLSPAPPAVPAR